jgi:NADP-dependent 3-hydroxy acid dehydrogenase YdfG
MTDHIHGKSIIITGAGSGFGRLVAEKAAAAGAKVTLGDINLAAAEAVAAAIRASGGTAQAIAVDVTQIDQMRALAAAAVAAYGAIDVMINNAGTMPLALMADHAIALDKWHQCIDINFKGVVNGCVAVHDQMIAQGHGHVINLSSIYGNHPVLGSAVYGATKAAVNYFSESFRVDTRGKIKVTIIKPTGVPGTNLGSGVINPAAIAGIMGQNMPEFTELAEKLPQGTYPAEKLDPANISYAALAPEHIADAILYAINQPLGVSIGDITIRAAGDQYIL